jgi:flagellar hook-associated protein 2
MSFKISGLGSGVSWDSYIETILRAEQEKMGRTILRQEAKNSAVQSVFGNIKGVVSNLRSSVRDFEFSGDFKIKNVSSSNAETIKATASLSAVLQSVSIDVQQMATSEQHRLAFKSDQDVVTNADAKIKITVRGVEHEIEVKGGTTFAEFRNVLSAKRDLGVSISIYDSKDGTETPFRLTIQDRQLGDFDDNLETDNISFDLSQLDQLQTSFTKFIEAKDTIVLVNGEIVKRKGHRISDVIPGVSLDILREDPGNPVTLTVTESTNNANQKVKSLVENYNQAIQYLKQSLRFDADARVQTNPTAGDSTLRNTLTRLQSLFSGEVLGLPEDQKIRSLGALGVETQFSTGQEASNGFLNFDEAKFNQALADNYDEVIRFFEGLPLEGIGGFAKKAAEILDSFVNSTDGVLTTKMNSLTASLKGLGEQKAKAMERLVQMEDDLTKKFARLETQLAKLNGQQSQVSAAIQSLQLTNTAIANRKR